MIWDKIVFFKNDIKGKKEEAIQQLLSEAQVDNALINRVLGRENDYSSAVGKGVSFIGIQKPLEKPIIIVGVSKEGIDWDAFDGIPVNIIIVFIGGRDAEEYVDNVSSILSLINQSAIRRNIVQSRSREGLISVVKKEELNE